MKRAVVFYDSFCLYSMSLQYILKHDKQKHFSFSALNSTFAKPYKLSSETVAVLTTNYELLSHHNAVKYIIKQLPKVKWVLFVFYITPGFLQRFVSELISKNRKNWFGTTNCFQINMKNGLSISSCSDRPSF